MHDASTKSTDGQEVQFTPIHGPAKQLQNRHREHTTPLLQHQR